MGFPNIYHIAPAVLYMNPGVTRDEFFSLLDKTHGSWDMHTGDGSEEIPLEYYDHSMEDKNFHSLEGLAKLLCLPYSQEFNKIFFEKKFDESGIMFNNTFYYPELSGPGTFTIYIHEKNSLMNPERLSFIYGRGIKVGSTTRFSRLFDDDNIPPYAQDDFERRYDFALIKEIHSKKFKGLRKAEDSKYPIYRYDVTLIPFKKTIRKEIYNSIQELRDNWPVFSPDGMYDWSKDKGYFTHRAGIFPDFIWYKKDDRYYLDERSFQVMSATNYRQLILACEAIKTESWKPLSYYGGLWWGQFLKRYPDSKQEFNYAGHVAQLSESAKKRGLTNNQFLRSMMLGSTINNNFYDREIF